MTDTPTQFTTCPNCGIQTAMPDEDFIVAWVKQHCIRCDAPSIAPKAFSMAEAETILREHSLFGTIDSTEDNGNE